MTYYLESLQKYLVFSGRSRRKEYWFFVLFQIIIGLALGVTEAVLGLFPPTDQSVLSSLWGLATFLPGLGVAIRRLHDTDRSGWWILFGFLPIIGVIVLIVFMCQDSTPGENKYGANPKGT